MFLEFPSACDDVLLSSEPQSSDPTKGKYQTLFFFGLDGCGLVSVIAK